ncbi:hypothetical protein FVR03_20000 [Pontibacter qinzhouensis]|uniref:Uncharacterized protein n=1 Tax=Pontibacter qinzhouensis TaxID=2603253 RepID=A0A5C8J4C8_9BACT|nr:hypothetical protein [Pontibacter qinzhouensis]TXK31125.1 hypothetical protein FVR03_20000 [Pontibacter qinzhouensis]
MLLFRRKSALDKPPEGSDARDKAARAIAAVIVNRQLQLAKCCSSRYERLSLGVRKALLLLLCMLFGGTSLWFLARGVWPEQMQQALIHVQSYKPDNRPIAGPNLRDSLNRQHNLPLKK